jgi:imidazoleglycerol-phosphate dehydratase
MKMASVSKIPISERYAELSRRTSETDISVKLNIDGRGSSKIATGIAFFDHMLTSLTRHALFDLELNCRGDLEVDFHHTVEDCGIVIGKALETALGDKRGIRRFGFAYAPMDDALVRCVVDLSGRPFLHYGVKTRKLYAGDFPIQLMEEFFRALANNAQANVHVELLYGKDAHHITEAAFKALAKALDFACQRDLRTREIPSTKGQL